MNEKHHRNLPTCRLNYLRILYKHRKTIIVTWRRLVRNLSCHKGIAFVDFAKPVQHLRQFGRIDWLHCDLQHRARVEFERTKDMCLQHIQQNYRQHTKMPKCSRTKNKSYSISLQWNRNHSQWPNTSLWHHMSKGQFHQLLHYSYKLMTSFSIFLITKAVFFTNELHKV